MLGFNMLGAVNENLENQASTLMTVRQGALQRWMERALKALNKEMFCPFRLTRIRLKVSTNIPHKFWPSKVHETKSFQNHVNKKYL